MLPGIEILPRTLDLINTEEHDGEVTLFELQIICSLASGVAFEFGTFKGRTSLNIAKVTGQPVYTLDILDCKEASLPLEGADRKYIQAQKEKHPEIVHLYGDSATFDFSPYYKKINTVFVDGSHSFEYVMNDSIKALDLVESGIILWHDYERNGHWPGLIRALDKLHKEDKRFLELRHIKGTKLALLQI